MPIFDWSKTPASNGNADPTINFTPQMAPSALAPSMRAVMTAVAQWRDDIAGAIVTTGTSTSYSLSTNSDFTAEAQLAGQLIAFTPHVTNGAGPVDLTVDSAGTYPVRSSPGVDLPAGVLIEGTPYCGVLNEVDGAIYLRGFYGNPYGVAVGMGLTWYGSSAPNSSFAFPYGQTLSATTYSALYSVIGTTFNTGGEPGGTFRLPDERGKVQAAPDNMGGTAANVLTSAYFGKTAALAAVGGSPDYEIQRSDLPNVAPSVTVNGVANGATIPLNQGNIPEASNGYANGVIVNNGGSGAALASSGATLVTPNVNVTVGVGSINGNVAQTNINTIQPTICVNKLIRII